jgi:hypothetical protein
VLLVKTKLVSVCVWHLCLASIQTAARRELREEGRPPRQHCSAAPLRLPSAACAHPGGARVQIAAPPPGPLCGGSARPGLSSRLEPEKGPGDSDGSGRTRAGRPVRVERTQSRRGTVTSDVTRSSAAAAARKLRRGTAAQAVARGSAGPGSLERGRDLRPGRWATRSSAAASSNRQLARHSPPPPGAGAGETAAARYSRDRGSQGVRLRSSRGFCARLNVP